MVERINFMERGKFVLTYKSMVQLAVLWFAGCIVIFMLIGMYSWYVGKSVDKYKFKLRELNIQKNKTMALLEASKTVPSGTNVKRLSEIYAHYPVWSDVMGYLSRNMPPQTWLNSVTTEYLGENTIFRKIQITGEGQNTASIARFVSQLNKHPLLNNMVLSRSSRKEVKEEKQTGYSFIILGEIAFKEKVWN